VTFHCAQASNRNMKPLAAIASATLALVVLASASAQRGGAARGGFSAHSAPSLHPSFAPSYTARSYPGPAFRYSGRPFAATPRIAVAPSAARPAFYSLRRPPIADRRRYDSRVAVPYAYPGVYADYGFIDPGYTDVPYGDASTQPIYPDPGLDQQPAQQPVLSPRYAAPPQPPPAEEEAVTLVFKDGRPSEQIHNYMLTRTMLYVRDQHRRDIPVAQLDLAATQKANQDNGVEFALPSAN